jgi:hypothetical protein
LRENLKFEELPGISESWLAFLKTGRPFASAPPTLERLAAHADDIRRAGAVRKVPIEIVESFSIFGNTERLRRAGSVAVIANVYPGLLGGPLAQIFKCLTAIKLCAELTKHGIDAVPIAWIHRAVPKNFPGWSVHLLDVESEIHTLAVAPGELVPGDLNSMLAEIKGFGEAFDPEILEIAETAFIPGTAFSSASARFLSAVTKEWGMPAIDPVPDARYSVPLMQSAILPVLAYVVDYCEIEPVAEALQVFSGAALAPPLAWPAASCTAGDVKSRRTLGRYGIDPVELYRGEAQVLLGVANAMPRTIPAKIRALKEEFVARLADIKSAAPGELSESADSCKEKIMYQLDKISDQSATALKMKEQTANRQIHKACNVLAPYGKLQERVLAGIQIPLSYSREGFRRLYEALDIFSFEHQLIWMG